MNTPPLKKTRSPRGDTRLRIIDCAIQLFNRHGVQSVTIEHICTTLKISPGNLTYHFKRKEALVQATMEVLQKELQIAFQQPKSVLNAQQGVDYLLRAFVKLWGVRFYFNSMAFLLTDNEPLRAEHETMRGWIVESIQSGLETLCTQGIFHPPVPPNNFRLLAENIWALFLNWIRQHHVMHPAALEPPTPSLYDVALHLWSVCQLWMEPVFARALLTTFEDRLAPEPALSAA